ncbi:hypothetical protein AVEN_193352-1 [Araneus ventricosus]|uniref:Uncharacterized protein n=1 Tax=Araneus ventricosus TaxID=182803 RepID=A0A4Y2EPN9_ARAVE|nr:hypothetical protein AVEN_193352-1 [Araneus ventricosus]
MGDQESDTSRSSTRFFILPDKAATSNFCGVSRFQISFLESCANRVGFRYYNFNVNGFLTETAEVPGNQTVFRTGGRLNPGEVSKSVPRTSGPKIWWVIHSQLYPRATPSYGIGLTIGAVHSTVSSPHATFKTGPPCPNSLE